MTAQAAELFSFPLTGTVRGPERIDTLPTINILEPQTLAPLPDGRFLTMEPATPVGGATPELHVVLNWFEELKRLVPAR